MTFWWKPAVALVKFRLSREAVEDLADLYVEGYHQFGEQQAEAYHAGMKETFAILARFPRMARERDELNRPVRVHPHASHLVIYLIEDDGILIVRVRHGREDWESALQ
jgi:toxin ParE1/3/4